MKSKTEKKFDCIAFKRKAQSIIYEEIKDMSDEEILEYWKSVRTKSEQKKRLPLSKQPLSANN